MPQSRWHLAGFAEPGTVVLTLGPRQVGLEGGESGTSSPPRLVFHHPLGRSQGPNLACFRTWKRLELTAEAFSSVVGGVAVSLKSVLVEGARLPDGKNAACWTRLGSVPNSIPPVTSLSLSFLICEMGP